MNGKQRGKFQIIYDEEHDWILTLLFVITTLNMCRHHSQLEVLASMILMSNSDTQLLKNSLMKLFRFFGLRYIFTKKCQYNMWSFLQATRFTGAFSGIC